MRANYFDTDVAAEYDDPVGIDEHDSDTQLAWSHHCSSTDGVAYHRRSTPFRKVWPSDLDLMARIAGMRLVSRWADWDRSPFSGASAKLVSGWERVAA